MKAWILHAWLELNKGMVARLWSGVFFCGTAYVYQPPSMQFGNPFMLFFYPHGNGAFQQDDCTSHKSRLATGLLDEHSSDFTVIN
ncbi:hypothetical protein TNCV_3831421 [Trichonephila clavipes]|nr:hypothetical protein TNCV_3831421 [Trichonephila clavipes]